ncbi:hypothetical protein ACIBTV_08650 [Micromonospora sp. NPDC049366]|uniref:hypothetical protein n=1 Tax=Micromonospora sp. NPDC049366 TaxID=3364271 RepID=UPI0037874FB4
MSTAGPTTTIGLTTISRTVASLAVGVVHTLERAVVGEGRMRTARGNAWEAVCADRARADRRAELDRVVAQLAADRRLRESANRPLRESADRRQREKQSVS